MKNLCQASYYAAQADWAGGGCVRGLHLAGDDCQWDDLDNERDHSSVALRPFLDATLPRGAPPLLELRLHNVELLRGGLQGCARLTSVTLLELFGVGLQLEDLGLLLRQAPLRSLRLDRCGWEDSVPASLPFPGDCLAGKQAGMSLARTVGVGPRISGRPCRSPPLAHTAALQACTPLGSGITGWKRCRLLSRGPPRSPRLT